MYIYESYNMIYDFLILSFYSEFKVQLYANVHYIQRF